MHHFAVFFNRLVATPVMHFEGALVVYHLFYLTLFVCVFFLISEYERWMLLN
jgi:hypothetical protein